MTTLDLPEQPIGATWPTSAKVTKKGAKNGSHNGLILGTFFGTVLESPILALPLPKELQKSPKMVPFL